MEKQVILHVIDHLEQGGAQEGVADILEAEDPSFEHHLFVLRNSAAAKKIESPNIRFSESSSRYSLFPLIEYYVLLNILKPAVQHAHLARSQLLTALVQGIRRILRKKRVPLIFHERGIVLMQGKLLPFLLALLAPFADRFIAVSNAAREALLTRLRLKSRNAEVITIYNGVNADRIQNKSREAVIAPSSELRLCFAGRLETEKGCQYLIPALSELEVEFRAVILGEGSQRAELEKQSIKLGLAPRVQFLGAVANALPEIAAADVLLLPSISDALPRSIIEALTLGTPVIASRVGGIPELIEHGGNGLLLEPEDSDALAAAITELASSEALREKFSRNAIEKSKKFEFRHFQESLHRVYQELIESSQFQ